MLTHLSIKNLAVIDSAQIDFTNGFNILTGETGAGKSVIINSINIIKGERCSKDLIRTGQTSARVDAIFEVSPFVKQEIEEKLGIEIEDDEVMISREFNLEGKNNVRINTIPITTSILKEIGESLVNIHGQHDTSKLLYKKNHIAFLDEFGGENLNNIFEEYKAIHTRYIEVKEELESLSEDENEKARRLDLLKYQIEEIEVANLLPDEEDELIERRNLLANAQKISKCALLAFDYLYDGENCHSSAHDNIWNAIKQIEEISGFNAQIETILKELTDITYVLSDNSHALKKIADNLDADEYELANIEERLDEIYNLKRKYGNSINDILAYLKDIKKEYEDIENSDERIKKLEEELKELELKRLKKATDLTLCRKKNAKILTEKILDELKDLEMAKTVFEVKIEDCEFTLNGKDDVEFLISTNVGEMPKPLSKIASGGEMSRIILAIKSVITTEKYANTLIFDEVDTGVSGKTAQKIGEKLYAMSKDNQVICITHLSQIASFADNHLFIEKKSDDGRTATTITPLDEERRIDEIARILGGEVITDLTKENAKEQLEMAKNIKEKTEGK
ncbi:MAG: DNA repair protein RecN [Ruminococcaceae bacterium]|nr:DNA repair protein RecN [Oscillospiraceae bacterium]